MGYWNEVAMRSVSEFQIRLALGQLVLMAYNKYKAENDLTPEQVAEWMANQKIVRKQDIMWGVPHATEQFIVATIEWVERDLRGSKLYVFSEFSREQKRLLFQAVRLTC